MAKQIVYALTNSAMPGLVKIGKTTQEDISTRMSQLYSTGIPVPFECIYAVEVDDGTTVESALHVGFGPYRINPKREFFKIDPEQAIAILSLLGPNNAINEVTKELEENISQAERDSGEKLKKRPNMDFIEMGLQKEDLLYFVDDESITVEIYDNKKIKYKDKITSLTKVTKEIMNLDYAIQPSPKWKYNGRLLKDIYEEMYSDEDA
jgi:hypothetical protein